MWHKLKETETYYVTSNTFTHKLITIIFKIEKKCEYEEHLRRRPPWCLFFEARGPWSANLNIWKLKILD